MIERGYGNVERLFLDCELRIMIPENNIYFALRLPARGTPQVVDLEVVGLRIMLYQMFALSDHARMALSFRRQSEGHDGLCASGLGCSICYWGALPPACWEARILVQQ